MSWNGTVRCGNCYDKGHNRNGCPKLKEEMQKRIEADPEDYYAQKYFEKKHCTFIFCRIICTKIVKIPSNK